MRATITVEYEAIDPARPWKWSVDWSGGNDNRKSWPRVAVGTEVSEANALLAADTRAKAAFESWREQNRPKIVRVLDFDDSGTKWAGHQDFIVDPELIEHES